MTEQTITPMQRDGAKCICAEVEGENPDCPVHELTIDRIAAWEDWECATREVDGYVARRVAQKALRHAATERELAPKDAVPAEEHVLRVNEAHRVGYRTAMETAREDGPAELIEQLLCLKRYSASIYGPLIGQTCAVLADAKGMREALERIASNSPRPEHIGRQEYPLRCQACHYRGHSDGEERHSAECAYVIARAALQSVPVVESQFVPEPPHPSTTKTITISGPFEPVEYLGGAGLRVLDEPASNPSDFLEEAALDMLRTARELRENPDADCPAIEQAIFWEKRAAAIRSLSGKGG